MSIQGFLVMSPLILPRQVSARERGTSLSYAVRLALMYRHFARLYQSSASPVPSRSESVSCTSSLDSGPRRPHDFPRDSRTAERKDVHSHD